MIQSHASDESQIFRPKPSIIWFLAIFVVIMVAILVCGGPKARNEQAKRRVESIMIKDRFPQPKTIVHNGHDIGGFSPMSLAEDGELKLAIGHTAAYWSYPQMLDTLNLEWWQLVEREDRHGYPRIDPQSGGSGLPGARGEDEDPAYYSKANLEDPELRPRIFAEGKYWLLDRPSLENSIRCESWLVDRTGPKAVTFIAGVSWGITAQDGKPLKLHHPQRITQRSRYDWHESLRISGFGSGWDIKAAYHSTLP